MKVFLWVVFIVFLVVIGPILTIWAANTLFPVLAIPYTIETWFAVVVLGAFVRSNIKVSK